MCTASGPSEIIVPSITPRDTSNELIKSNYELSAENKKKNAEIAARNKAKSLVSFGNDNETTGKGVTFSGPQPTGQPIGSGLGTGTGALGMDLG